MIRGTDQHVYQMTGMEERGLLSWVGSYALACARIQHGRCIRDRTQWSISGIGDVEERTVVYGIEDLCLYPI
eukprot:659169-Rhodomonas_salina.1